MKPKEHISSSYFGTQTIPKILLKTAPPVMLALLIQALYNIVDSFFVGKYSDAGLTALSVIFPIQLIISALAVGTGVGVNTYMARLYAENEKEKADRVAGTGLVLAIIMWFVFSVISVFIIPPYVKTSSNSESALGFAVEYGIIVCVGSIGLFTESIFTKIRQANGDMFVPMIAQISGAVLNIILDPILIFGAGPIPPLGIAGAAYATVAGQILAAVITGIKCIKKPPSIKKIPAFIKKILYFGYPSILMQSLYTVYIMVLNIILASFSDEAVTVLGLYYKIQTFFFIPLSGLQTCIVPIISYNFARKMYDRVKKTMLYSTFITVFFMLIGTLCFEFIPTLLLKIFSDSEKVAEIGSVAFRIIGISFVPATFSLMLPIFFQAVGKGLQSTVLTLMRQIMCLIPIFYLMSLIGLNYTWIAFPAAEIITGTTGIILYLKYTRSWNKPL